MPLNGNSAIGGVSSNNYIQGGLGIVANAPNFISGTLTGAGIFEATLYSTLFGSSVSHQGTVDYTSPRVVSKKRSASSHTSIKFFVNLGVFTSGTITIIGY